MFYISFSLFHHLHAIFKLSNKCGRCNIRMILGYQGKRVEKLDTDSELPMCCVQKSSKQLLLHICYKKHQFKSRIVSTNKPLRPVMSLQSNVITTSRPYSFKICNSSTFLQLGWLITDLYHKFITLFLHLSIAHLYTAVLHAI